jgi:multidrug efflux pump subunit AcrB
LQDRAGRTLRELDMKTKVMQAMSQRPQITGVFSGYRTSIPQIKLDIDRIKPEHWCPGQQRVSGIADLSWGTG